MWEVSAGTMVSVENKTPVITTVLIVWGAIFWYESYDVERCPVDDTFLTSH